MVFVLVTVRFMFGLQSYSLWGENALSVLVGVNSFSSNRDIVGSSPPIHFIMIGGRAHYILIDPFSNGFFIHLKRESEKDTVNEKYN